MRSCIIGERLGHEAQFRLLGGGGIGASVAIEWLITLSSIGCVQVFWGGLTSQAPISSGTPQSAEAR